MRGKKLKYRLAIVLKETKEATRIWYIEFASIDNAKDIAKVIQESVDGDTIELYAKDTPGVAIQVERGLVDDFWIEQQYLWFWRKTGFTKESYYG